MARIKWCRWFFLIVNYLLFSSYVLAAKPILVAQQTACIVGTLTPISPQRDIVALKLLNNCNQTVDFQNITVTFNNKENLSASFWGDFSPLSYPDSQLTMTSQYVSSNLYLTTFKLHFPTYSGANSRLPAGKAITIKYQTKPDIYIDGSVKAYLASMVNTGNINVINSSSKPANANLSSATVRVTLAGQLITETPVPWSSQKLIEGLAEGTYTLTANSFTDTLGNTYQGTATPSVLTVLANNTVSSVISYAMIQQSGKVAINMMALPIALTGYTAKPNVVVTQAGTGSSVSIMTDWGVTTVVNQLKNGSVYSFATPLITYNGYNCVPSFTPSSLTASEVTPTPATSLSYACNQIAQDTVTINVTGAPSSLTSLRITLTPNNGASPVSKVMTLTNGSGVDKVQLTDGVIYTLSSDNVAGYNINFNPQPLTALPNAVVSITLASTTGTPISLNGQLKVCGTQLCNESGTPIQLRGMSTHGLQWYGPPSSHNCLTTESLDVLAKDFGASVMRISMYVQEGGYETNPTKYTAAVNQLIAEATKRGIYAIVDWHMLDPGDPNYNLERAKTFFTEIATANKGKNNLLYEIANEPSGVSWSTIKAYAEKLIPVIRAIDPKSVILVGTVGWSSLGISDGRTSQDIINAPLNFSNIMYTFHFYAASHRDEYLNELNKASNVLPIFVTEFGSQTYTGDGQNDFTMANRYLDLMASKKISWTNWNYSDDFRSGAVWTQNTCSSGPWVDSRLKPAGVWVKAKIKG